MNKKEQPVEWVPQSCSFLSSGKAVYSVYKSAFVRGRHILIYIRGNLADSLLSLFIFSDTVGKNADHVRAAAVKNNSDIIFHQHGVLLLCHFSGFAGRYSTFGES